MTRKIKREKETKRWQDCVVIPCSFVIWQKCSQCNDVNGNVRMRQGGRSDFSWAGVMRPVLKEISGRWRCRRRRRQCEIKNAPGSDRVRKEVRVEWSGLGFPCPSFHSRARDILDDADEENNAGNLRQCALQRHFIDDDDDDDNDEDFLVTLIPFPLVCRPHRIDAACRWCIQ